MQASDFTEDASGSIVRNLQGDLAFIPNPLPPRIRWDDECVHLLTVASTALGHLAGIGHRLPGAKLALRSALRREAELSSRIEGTHARVEDILLFEHVASIEDDVPDVREVGNNFRALEYGLGSLDNRPINLPLIREMHQILLTGVRGHDKTPGQFRTVQAHIGRSNRIAEARFVPAPPHAVLPAMEALEQFITTPAGVPPLARAAMAHYQFEAIHPFADGNGRIGRVIILLMLSADRLLPVPLLNPSAYLERNRAEYYDHLLRVSQRGAWRDWIAFFARGVVEEAADAVDRVTRLDALRDRYRAAALTGRPSALLPRLIDQLFADPVITTKQAAEFLGVNPNSAQKSIDRLLSTDILREHTGQKRNRVYVAHEILTALNGPTAATGH